MKLKSYLDDHLLFSICFFAASILAFAFFLLLEIPSTIILLVEVLFLAAYAVSLLWDFLRRKTYYSQLLLLLKQLDQKTLLAEISPRPQFLDGEILLEILHQSNKYHNDQLALLERENREYREYLDTWVHEIKTPIASARLIVENKKNTTTLRIDDELLKIDGFVEQVLYYSRSAAVEKDFRVEQTTLKKLVSAALKIYSKPIIQAGGHIQMQELDVALCADVKSCIFVIGQIISNAIKYRQNELSLSFAGKRQNNRILLEISDKGIGVSSADLPRVFDKGFTGINGRRGFQSTGIGLYLCKKLCNKMNIHISINSALNKGCTVILSFLAENIPTGADM